ncbi:MAG: hypothetical protein MUC52_02820 [Candidatus Omnitrophica bacterium]|nr:hypothetical protein [Candidatus Omnitrophota bacterium]
MKLSIKICDYIIKVDGETEPERFNDFGFYRDFLTEAGQSCHCFLDHRISRPPDLELDANAFHTENWHLSGRDGRKVLCVGPRPKRGRYDNVVVFDRDYGSGIMYQKSAFELFRRFIDQFLIMNLLSRDSGFLLHASGVVWNNKGICFTGPSGSGKSTMLNMFKGLVPKDCLLNDDRLALRNYGNHWRVFGTPWYGESRVSSPAGADLSALFFIRHCAHNYIRKLSASEILPQLMVLGLLPLWDKVATSQVLGSFQNLIRSIPAYEFGFLPDKSALELIKKVV